ncbi:type-F conjugative transfer system secretin TraK [Parasphingorhabdus sp. JC815]|uniref:type-F conjugative transfer system secretin TraK n=1 Tax=Parasphingorhabdus sp. JC815 TaxID=3232140 RepID=UPI00345AEAB3
MNLISSCTSGALAGTGLALFSFGVSRRLDLGFKPLGLAMLAFAVTVAPAHADQFVEAADNAQIDCLLSRGELTRIALVDDGFANVSKIASGYPYNDFSVTHEPVRGDIYISVPVQYASDRISFFATSKAGYVYKFACRAQMADASQIFITNAALAKSEARDWENETDPQMAEIRLIEAMASDAVLPGFTVTQKIGHPKVTAGLEVQLIGQYEGAQLFGQHFLIRNKSSETLDLTRERDAPAGARAFAYGAETLEPGQSASAFLVFAKGGID